MYNVSTFGGDDRVDDDEVDDGDDEIEDDIDDNDINIRELMCMYKRMSMCCR